MAILVSQVVESAASFEDGLAVSAQVLSALASGEKVDLSFRGIDTITTSFLNGLFVTIVRERGSAFLFERVNLRDVGRQPREMIVNRLLRRIDEIEPSRPTSRRAE